MLRARGSFARTLCLTAFVSLFVISLAAVSAVEEEGKAQKGPPFPLHSIEGVGGLPITPSAYLVNPGPEGDIFGKPAVSAHAIWVGDKDMQVLAATWTLCRRIELGYAVNRLALDDFDGEVRNRTGLNIGADQIYLHHFNARLNVIPENLCEMMWVPAVTAGVHYKYNNNIDEINRDLGDGLETIGYNDNDGVDFTLTASKTITSLPRPVMFSLGARASKASQFGLMGFGSDYMVSFEGNVDVLVTDKLAIGGEFRDKPDVMGRIPDLVAEDDPWWDVHAAYFLSPHSSLYAVAGDAGGVANHRDEFFWGLVFKYDF